MPITFLAGQTITLNDASSEDGVIRYQKTIDLPLANITDGQLSLIREATQCAITAATRTVNVFASDSPISVLEKTVREQALVIKLDQPYAISSLTFSATKNTRSKQQQGSNKSVQAIQNFTASVATIALHRVDGDNIIDEASVTVAEGQSISDFSADHFAIRYLNSDGSPRSITTNTFDELRVKVPPSGLKLACYAPATGPDSADYFWHAAEQADNIVLSHEQNSQAAQRFHDALQRSIDNHGPALALLIVADKPARLTLSALQFDYQLQITALIKQQPQDSEQPKISLHYAGNTLQQQAIFATLPNNNPLAKAQLRFKHRGDGSQAWPVEQALTDINSLKNGVLISPQSTVAQSVVLQQPLKLAGYLLPIQILQAPLVIHVELRANWQNSPAGDTLADFGNVTLDAQTLAGSARQWLNLNYPEPLIQDKGQRWLRLSVKEGEGLWLTEAASGENLLPLTLYTNNSAAPSHITRQAAHYRHTIAADKAANFSARLEQTELPISQNEAGENLIELSSAINLLLPGLSSNQPVVELTLSSTTAGAATVYAAELYYGAESLGV
jgi:hypothetical protein